MMVAEKQKHIAVFLDRDGTINVEKEYLFRAEDFEFIDGAPEAIGKLKEAGYLVIVVTNQSGVARGYYSLSDVDTLHEYVQQELARHNAVVDAFYVCPHHPEQGSGEFLRACDCRKGAPGMLLKAASDYTIDLSRSYMVGDKIADIEAAENAGCQPIMVMTGYGRVESKKLTAGRAVCCENIAAAVEVILRADDKD
jgi:D-glycero-D-manno-heptose 1,7-bisphosphate phosphatase